MTMWHPEIETSGKAAYLAIADALGRDIADGQIAIDEQLPTHRELAESLGVAIGTVTRAYREAERRGLVRGEVGRGTFVGPPPSAMAVRLEPQGVTPSPLIDLSCNYPVYSKDPCLSAALRAVARKPGIQELLRYHPHAGMWRHRIAGAAWALRYGVTVDPECVLVCNGAQHALAVTLSAIADPGDLVATETLTYPGMKSVADMLRLRLQGVAMDDDGLVPEAFASLCRQRHVRALYLMPTVHNPTSSTLPESRRREIARIAEENDVAIIEDDVHRLLADDPPPPIQSFAPDRTYFIAGLSKCVAGGLRIGYLVAPVHAVERLTQSIWATSWMAAPLTAEIAAMWIEDGTADRAAERKRVEIVERQGVVSKLLDAATYKTAPHAFHIWLQLPLAWRSAAFANEARRRGVAVTPAEVFAVGPAPNAVRACIGAAEDRDQLEAGLKLLTATMACPPGTCPAIL